MNKCPCEQCISYAICYARIREIEIPDVVMYSGRRKCTDLRDYLFSKEKDRVMKTRIVFGLPKIKPWELEL